jgi:hypothetical protein
MMRFDLGGKAAGVTEADSGAALQRSWSASCPMSPFRQPLKGNLAANA